MNLEQGSYSSCMHSREFMTPSSHNMIVRLHLWLGSLMLTGCMSLKAHIMANVWSSRVAVLNAYTIWVADDCLEHSR